MWRPRFLSPPAAPRVVVRPSPTLFAWLVGAFLLALLPQVGEFPLWITAAVVIAMAARVVLEIYRLPLPGTAFTGILAICLLAGICLQYRGITGRDAGTAFMAALLAIKFFEIRGPRDISIIVFSCFFVVMSSLLYSQVLELFVYCLIMMWVLTALLLRTQLGDRSEDHLLRMLGRASAIFLQALPLALVLFFFFPRYAGKFGFGSEASTLGLTDTIKPGSIAQLVTDDSEAMRVRFTQGNVPSPETMYWRALVLWQFREGTWTTGFPASPAALRQRQLPRAASGGDLIEQEITIEPHHHRWLFALDCPVDLPVGLSARAFSGAPTAVMMEGHVLQLAVADGTVDHRERYSVTSSLRLARQGALSPLERDWGTRLPGKTGPSGEEEIEPRVLNLAESLQAQNPGTLPYIQAVLHYFRQQHFTYTDTPGAEGPHALVTFLFESKRGFCEHFASAFAVLMRIAHHPARVVVGYHGATYNPYGNFYIVKQSNAHAWDEVWDDEAARWLRVDPTSVLRSDDALIASVSPDRANGDGLTLQSQHRAFLDNALVPDWVRRGVVELQLRRQELEADWDDLVISYDPGAQSRLAQALGFGRRGLPWLLAVSGVGAALCAGVALFALRRNKPVAPVEILYARFCRAMKRRGLPRAEWEGPLAYADRIAGAIPEKGAVIREVGSLVARARYGPQPHQPETAEQLRAILPQLQELAEPVLKP
jgi:hypothetical protein